MSSHVITLTISYPQFIHLHPPSPPHQYLVVSCILPVNYPGMGKLPKISVRTVDYLKIWPDLKNYKYYKTLI